MASFQNNRRAFSLVELLLVMAIIGLLFGLTMPAVQRARESANAASCLHNLGQIGKAIHLYADDNKQYLPAGRLDNGSATWAVLIFPYVERQAERDAWDLTKPYAEQSKEAREPIVPVFFCPSRRSPGTPPLSYSGDSSCKKWVEGPLGPCGPTWHCLEVTPHVPGALGDYAGCIGTAWQDCDCHFFKSNGAFQFYNPWDRGVSLLEIISGDGSSNTLLVGDKNIPEGSYGHGGLDGCMYNGSGWSSIRPAGELYPLAKTTRDWSWSFGSLHPGVCHFVFVDGHAKRVSNSINPTTLERLADRADGLGVPDGDW